MTPVLYSAQRSVTVIPTVLRGLGIVILLLQTLLPGAALQAAPEPVSQPTAPRL